ncbi:lipopolysaccharide transport periplasmic protein LptA [Thalassolituus sp.]|jgi:lipopolysaccharide export system protein LptA|uniref:lipopolysaccharide transport periplasmic protein LptA n=1 Tax=Thalassolituus sp. TaxID=2030822 RepID=UPI0026269AA0|nr:lipopolysaccharide transport periplasmic protein LptA [uncultured Thalassolituus sp.]
MSLNKLLLAALACLPVLSNALQQDWQQEMTILSDRAEIDRRAGTVIYEGNVVLTQGTLKIEAERLLILRDGDVLEKAVAEGSPARYEQEIEPGKPVTHAHGNRIDYYTADRRITLRGDAELEQDGNVFSGDTITYDMNTETVKASGNKANENIGQTTEDGRIKVVIQPQKAPETP